MASFEARVAESLEVLKRLLHNEKDPVLAEDAQHSYRDKFGLVDFMTLSTIAALFNVLCSLGASDADLTKMKEWSSKRSVTLRFSGLQNCTFDRKEEHEEKSASTSVHESTLFGTSKSFTVTKVRFDGTTL